MGPIILYCCLSNLIDELRENQIFDRNNSRNLFEKGNVPINFSLNFRNFRIFSSTREIMSSFNSTFYLTL